ncbi:uncharacterized protein KY384_004398 [Bacidia gigantensis]|uniref:uncharacterized protein n=1 Tax=Bacidia gigantensis TaxID=2732470 RepID=UPI001D05AC71|nr:uncharacterized protein KY384_004398 [Bacidia gigantensis]KAG8531041.1 hypothetical protein KY384_004398 [Bacidia gigantensis]
MSSSLMDTEAGGEQTQYEGISTHQEPHSKRGGQMGNAETEPDSVSSVQDAEKAEKGEKKAENIRYGQGISEGGMGGKTTESEGTGNQASSYGASKFQDDSQSAEETREIQGYGGGSGVGG